ncbi:GAP family protein [Corynebacterium sp. YIM 101645]|uniref:GAP family protein n=1 Tax=Corynebacterium lemuris TaxID=1859292 RepID=A0ABT2FYS5_9CORY|nr:GAP family protein [Corynebacterium lemuris]MCS5480383.1 GAP family protein [Corynebacterium lemuris]
MFQAVSFALLDSLNALLIGVIVALGVMLPRTGRYRRIVTLLIAGDWLGVLLLALVTLLIFDGLGDLVQQALESPVFGILLIVTGVITLVLTARNSENGDSALVRKLLEPLQTPSAKTVGVGFLLGVIQSATSFPFFFGLGYLSTSGYGPAVRYIGLFFYASLALSLPAISAFFVGMVRAYPYSLFGRAFEYMRTRQELMVKLAGYVVAVALTVFGISALL